MLGGLSCECQTLCGGRLLLSFPLALKLHNNFPVFCSRLLLLDLESEALGLHMG